MGMAGQNGTNGVNNGTDGAYSSFLSKKKISKDLSTSLPARFYCSPEIYQLERRAIFSKRWFLVSHASRYHDVGDYVQYEMAGFNFFVTRNKESEIVGFHNVCRHRAFPIVQNPSGNARIFACKYHGWSYDLSGRLTKAPRFTADSVPSFDVSKIRLLPIHIHIDRNRFVYANLDAKESPEVSWEDQYGAMDQQDVLMESGVDWSNVEYDFTWTKEGHFNWKLMQDNYNECYHCSLIHPAVVATTNLETYHVVPGSPGSYISHFSQPKESILSQFDSTRFAGRSATWIFPVGHFSPNPGTGFMHLMRTVPMGPTTCRQEYDVYRLNTPAATTEAHQRMVDFYQQVTTEDVDVCNLVQRNVTRGVYVRGPLHPFHEEGVKAFQAMVKIALLEHAEAERKIGKEVCPAEQGEDAFGGGDKECESLLKCGRSSGLDW